MKEDSLNNKDLEQRLREEAESFQMQPSEQVWENIKEALPSENKRVYWWRWMATAAAVLLLAGLGWYFMTTSREQEKTTGRSIVFSDSPSSEWGNEPPITKKEEKQNDEESGIAEKGRNRVRGKEAGAKSEVSGLTASKNIASKPASQRSHNPLTTSDLPKPTNKNAIPALLAGKIPLQTAVSSTPSAVPLRYSHAVLQQILKTMGVGESSLAGIPSKQEGRRKISVGLYYTPGMSYRSLKEGTIQKRQVPSDVVSVPPGLLAVNDENLMMRVTRKEKPMQQKQSWGWGTGLRVGVPFGKNWMLQTGLSLQQTTYDIKAYKQDPAYVTDDGSSSMVAASAANSTFARFAGGPSGVEKSTTLENRYVSTELPLLIGKRFGHPDKLSFTLLAGAGLTYLIHSNAIIYAPQSQRYFSDDDYLSRFNSNLILEASMNIPLGNHFGFSIGPALQYQLFSSYKAYRAVQEYPYLIGIKTAFRLKK